VLRWSTHGMLPISGVVGAELWCKAQQYGRANLNT
jgi:hypothetical protein